eukprot:183686-Karenia_brevis.AAC.1
MGHEGKFPKLRSSEATDDMVAHVGRGRITTTSESPAPNGDIWVLHERNDPSGPSNRHEPNHGPQEGIGEVNLPALFGR